MPFSKGDIKYIKSQGWSFVPTGPNEWEWLLFSKEGKPIGQQLDAQWTKMMQQLDKEKETE